MPEVEIGRVSDFFARPVVAGITLSDTLKVGDKIHIKGHTFFGPFTSGPHGYPRLQPVTVIPVIGMRINGTRCFRFRRNYILHNLA